MCAAAHDQPGSRRHVNWGLFVPAWARVPFPIIGMLHAPALPGAPRASAPLAHAIDHVLRDAAALVDAGVDGLMLENFGDTPFFPRRVPHAVVAQLTCIALEIRRRHEIPLGINVLRNDASAALAIAHAVGAAFIRVNVLCGARVTDQGVIQGLAHRLLRERAHLSAEQIRILADVDVKHSAALGAPRSIEDEVADTLERAGADAVIVSGAGTGQPTDLDQLRRATAAAGVAPVLVGSGVTARTIAPLRSVADGAIVGTSLKVEGVPTNPVDPTRARELIAALAGV